MALSSLPDLLQSPVGRPRVELPVALPEARPALQADDGGGNLLVSDEGGRDRTFTCACRTRDST